MNPPVTTYDLADCQRNLVKFILAHGVKGSLCPVSDAGTRQALREIIYRAQIIAESAPFKSAEAWTKSARVPSKKKRP